MIPKWVDKSLYPWEPKEFDIDHKRMRYVDVGSGDPVVFVHGTPTWSFMYRDLIKGLSNTCRCIAPDNIGFGLSEKPLAYTFRPEKQADYLESLISHLELENITLVVHDFGGPIGLSYAINHPRNVKHCVVMNTWMWSLRANPRAQKVEKLVRSKFGEFLYIRMNASARFFMPLLFRDKRAFKGAVKRHYLQPFRVREQRYGPLGYAKALMASSAWYESLWERRANLQSIPSVLVWGMKDPFFGADVLERWTSVWPEAEIHKLPNTGHFVPEEHGSDVLPYVDMLMHDTSFLPTTTTDA
jgi:pimeloyl-ACP methyl ester carboxylesterase